MNLQIRVKDLSNHVMPQWHFDAMIELHQKQAVMEWLTFEAPILQQSI
jgi:hypothetical protein